MQVPELQGHTLGPYELQELLGQGGMGVVYRAHHSKMKRDVAVKILPSGNVNNEVHLKRFLREAEITALLEHPHIVPIYDYGSLDNLNYVIMRLLTGGSLTERMEGWAGGTIPRPPMSEIIALFKDIASALDYAHGKGAIHRDIKPGNVMFDNTGNVFVVDFGLVKLVDAARSVLTGSGIILGTPAYMAPEQWKDEPLTPAIDQYAVAILLFAAITGALPFDSDTPYELMQMHCYHDPPPAHLKRDDVSVEASAILERALSKHPMERFGSVSEFIQAFEDAVQQPQYDVDNTFMMHDPDEDEFKTLRPGEVPKPSVPKGIVRVEQSRDQTIIGKVVQINRFPFQIGRLNRDLNFDGDRNVSRNHLHITQDSEGKFFVEDQNSTLHTMVDGQQIEPYTRVQILHNASICLGTTTVLKFIIEE